MHLLNTKTLELKSFSDSKIPPYAILSHRWEDDEVDYQDPPFSRRTTRRKQGFTKIKKFCEMAALAGYEYAWADSCCIDKKSSAELTEAINAMYSWYSCAEECFVYLFDVGEADEDFDRSVWFTRAWTLQELIAPRKVTFFNREWTRIGNKKSLVTELAQITGIDESVLKGAKPERCSVAQRMSWAAKRTAERIEDRAYSLLGIFQVHLPIMYGIKEQAFARLQEEILKSSDDQSLFAWTEGFPDTLRGRCGLLASSPSAFALCNDVILPFLEYNDMLGDFQHKPKEYGMTNVGLRITLPLIKHAPHVYKAILDCRPKNIDGSRYAILVEDLRFEQQQYARIRERNIVRIICDPEMDVDTVTMTEMFFRQQPRNTLSPCTSYDIHIYSLELPGISAEQAKYCLSVPRDPLTQCPKEGHHFDLPEGEYGCAGMLYFRDGSIKEQTMCWLIAGIDFTLSPFLLLGNHFSLRQAFRNTKSLESLDEYTPLRNLPDADVIEAQRDLLSSQGMQASSCKGLYCDEEFNIKAVSSVETGAAFFATIKELDLQIEVSYELRDGPCSYIQDKTPNAWCGWTIHIYPKGTEAASSGERKKTSKRRESIPSDLAKIWRVSLKDSFLF